VRAVESDHQAALVANVDGVRGVSVQGLAQPWFVPTVRTVAADLAARADFDLDFISDLRMAVDEACAALVRLADPDKRLRCSFQLAADWMSAEVSVVPRERGAQVSTTGFGWRVLQSLVDEASVPTGDEDASQWVGIRLVKKQSAG